MTTGATAIGANAVLTSTGTAAGNAYGAYADAASIDLTGGSVTARGSNGAGLAVTGSGNINTTATNVTATGANSSGILGLGAGEVTMVGGSLLAEQGDLVRSEGGALDVTLDTVLTGTGSGMVLNVLDDAAGNHGSVNLSALNTILDGDIFAAADNIANVSLSGSELTGAANNATNISLDADSLWNMTASSTVSDTVTNAGMIAFSAPDAGVFKTLTTTNYVGDNGNVVLNTTLDANASPSDQIVINGGTASGQTGLAINNINGTGAPTTDGIKAQGQVTWYDSDLYSDTLRQRLADGSDGFGYALSLEAGKRIALNENWILTPQAQLTWSTVDFDSFIDPYGARVSLDKGDSLKGRLGLALGYEHSWKNDDGQTSWHRCMALSISPTSSSTEHGSMYRVRSSTVAPTG